MAAAPAAFASHGGGGVQASGACSASSTWKMTAKPDDGQLEVQFEVDSNVAGQTWNVRMSDNGTFFFKGKGTTGGASGSFEVKKFTADLAGTDAILGQAKNPATGETCQGSVSI
jgi:hypothetical protein